MLDSPRGLGWRASTPPQRFTPETLDQERMLPDELSAFDFLPRSPDRILSRAAIFAWRNKLHQFLRDEGVRLVIRQARGGEYGSAYVAGAGSPDPSSVDPPASIVLAAEHYNRIARLIEKQAPAEVSVEVEAGFETETSSAFNVIAEIPGRTRPGEVVMLGAHLDSWTGGTGATDNAAGCAVVMEAMRILKTLGLRPDRTVRAALWAGEEQGILGSQAWVKAHAGERETISVYFNHDYGAGRIRGVYLQNNDAARPVFEAWLRPLGDLGASTVTIRNSGGTDHLAFDAVGIPAFQFIQDPLEYGWRTHHSSMDTYERVPATDAMQSAAVLASLVYQAANAPGLVPRKPAPEVKR
ncbi:MAG: M20/M25/M40 family metallo-hydrolase [Acidobacteria bacterium]|nr:M20/M25/M40 family metallo-hydrolase [Acidobacteriota bacterium]